LAEPFVEEPLLELEEQAAPAMAIPATVTSATTVRVAVRFMRFTPSFVGWGGAVPQRRRESSACREGTAVNRWLQESDEKSKEYD
jgi:hypothetical protein